MKNETLSDKWIARYELPDSTNPITETYWSRIDSDELLQESVDVVHPMFEGRPMSASDIAFWKSIGSPVLNDVLLLTL